jgi:hypothetical protein
VTDPKNRKDAQRGLADNAHIAQVTVAVSTGMVAAWT